MKTRNSDFPANQHANQNASEMQEIHDLGLLDAVSGGALSPDDFVVVEAKLKDRAGGTGGGAGPRAL